MPDLPADVEAWAERSAIIEADTGLARGQCDRMAAHLLKRSVREAREIERKHFTKGQT